MLYELAGARCRVFLVATSSPELQASGQMSKSSRSNSVCIKRDSFIALQLFSTYLRIRSPISVVVTRCGWLFKSGVP